MKRLLCLGDSNTYGYDPRSYLGSRYPKDIRWTGLLEQNGRTVFNFGQNGLTIPGEYTFPALRQLLREKLPLDLVTVMLGSNDLLLGASVPDTAARMEALLRFLLQAADGAALLLIAPPLMELGEWVPNESYIRASEKLRDAYRDLAQKLAIPFADAGEWGVELCYDGVHFSPAGHRAFAQGLEAFLAEQPKESS